MCGITGFIDTRRQTGAEDLCFIAGEMAAQLHHRGPDDGDVWADSHAGVALGHRRLAILDLSLAGRQPMQSQCGRYWIVFNGEIYNFRFMRKQLEQQGRWFRGHSDMEVLLEAIGAWGMDRALEVSNGMFAFAVWDTQTRTLTLARDRLGEKPLYYGWAGPAFVFASELKALLRHPCFENRIDREALALYLRFGCVPEPFSIYQAIRKLPPGGVLAIHDFDPGRLPRPATYWSATAVAEAGFARPFTGDEREAADELHTLLKNAVRMRLEADVPLGAFLSGGVDSSTIVALMQATSSRRVRTFTIGFHEKEYNEAEHASRVAGHLGTDHTELYVTPAEMWSVIPDMPRLYDEPFSDSSQIPTYLVAKLARQSVTVALSGDGGDELFGGYPRYSRGRRNWALRRCIPRFLREPAARALRSVPWIPWSGTAGRKASRFGVRLAADDPDEFYLQMTSGWMHADSIVFGAADSLLLLRSELPQCELSDFTSRMMLLDTIGYLPGDILAKVDRATMGTSLEARAPMLDPTVVEFAFRLPLSLKCGNPSKRVLRNVLYRYVPKHLIERPKQGFGIPIGQWLCGPVREWSEDLLEFGRLKSEGYFDPRPIRNAWRRHLSGANDLTGCIWSVLMFEAWLDEVRNGKKPGYRPPLQTNTVPPPEFNVKALL